MSTLHLLDILAESQKALNEATRAENEKRVKVRQRDLQHELDQCAEAAEEGYQKAAGHLEAIKALIDEAKNTVRRLHRQGTTGQTIERDDQIYRQMDNATTEMQNLHDSAWAEINSNRSRLETFNIVLFGRTMTGKSTLMEILTQGDGSSIGKGAQRTTRDVRSYEWNGLTVTDVPGIAAFDGAKDEETAAEAANNADLIIYLITDDGAQSAEAEAIDMLRKTGTSILGICNVKRTVRTEPDIRRFLRDQEKIFDHERLNELVNTFHLLSGAEEARTRIKFQCTHLHSRFIADRPEHNERKTELTAASRFQDVEDQLYEEISRNGSFHRQRTFIESAAGANHSIWLHMLTLKESAYQIHDRLKNNAKETITWQKQFRQASITRMDSFIRGTVGKLRTDIPAFAELHCENKSLQAAWETKVKGVDITKRAGQLQKELQEEANEKVKIRIAEIGQELEDLQFRLEPLTTETGKIANHRKIWDWTMQGITATLGMAAVAVLPTPLFALSIPLGIAASIVGTIGLLFRRIFGNKAKRRQEAIQVISQGLHKSLDDLENTLRKQLTEWLDNQLVGQQIANVVRQFEAMASRTEQSAEFYQRQVEELNQQQQELNLTLLNAVMNHIGQGPASEDGFRVARNPGEAMGIHHTKGQSLQRPTLALMQSILQEPIDLLPSRCSRRFIFQWAAGEDADQTPINLDQKRKLARIPGLKKDKATMNRVDIAQQLTGFQITHSP